MAAGRGVQDGHTWCVTKGASVPDVDVVVRAPINGAERKAAVALATRTFVSQSPAAVSAVGEYLLGRPGANPRHVRGAYRGTECVGAYLLEQRHMRLQSATIPVGFIGKVVTADSHRGEGIGSAMMIDAAALARQESLALLLLHGIRGFYAQFGYTDIFDQTSHTVAGADVAAIASIDSCRLRLATPDDAAGMLRLYHDELAGYNGRTVRSLAEQEHQLAAATGHFGTFDDAAIDARPRVAVAPTGEIIGYLTFQWPFTSAFGAEAVATSWPSAAALLAMHAGLPRSSEDSAVTWHAPSRSRTMMIVTDHVPVTSTTIREPQGGWMAAVASPDVLLDAVAKQWTGHLPASADGLSLTVQETTYDIGAGRLHGLSIAPQPFTQCLFGYRPVDWATCDTNTEARSALATLDMLVGASPTWIAPTDGF